jgi:hypothetical protein
MGVRVFLGVASVVGVGLVSGDLAFFNYWFGVSGLVVVALVVRLPIAGAVNGSSLPDNERHGSPSGADGGS